ncbi:MAG: tyrosine-type recombinase/integrase [Bulleidia sp.]
MDGSIRYGSVYGKTYSETKEKLNEKKKSSQFEYSSPKIEKTFGDVVVMWLDNNRIRLKGGTVHKYQYLINNHILPELGSVKLSSMSAARINYFLNEKMENGRLDHNGGLSPSYVKTIMLIVNSVMHYAVNERMCLPLNNPVYMPKPEKKDLTILTLEEQKKLEQYLMTENNSTNIGIMLSLHAGLRIGEVCGLSWEDIDFEQGLLKVRHTVARVQNKDHEGKTISGLILDTPKTSASVRDIPLSAVLNDILMKYYAHSESPFVVSFSDSFLSPRTLEYRYHNVLKRCGVSDVKFHALRHTFATRCIESGMDVKSLSEILGHGNVSVTLNTYVHSSMERKRSQIEKMVLLKNDHH